MTPEEFVKNFYISRKWHLEHIFSDKPNPFFSKEVIQTENLIKDLNLNDEQTERLRGIVGQILTDTYYDILLGLDGSASIGGSQTMYAIYDEDGELISNGAGEIENFAYQCFHGNEEEFQKGEADFTATVTYLSTENGGRKTAAHSGYRPHIKFPFDEMQTSGQQVFIERNVVYPGETVQAAINIVLTDYFEGKLKEGMRFEFREGATLIGTGRINRIINESLRAR